MCVNHVNILLSTFNSAKYLQAQLDSLLTQSHQNFTIIIRDDGSTDNTDLLLRDYSERHSSHIHLILGEHIGANRSFLTLLQHCDVNCGYVAFCDHDDVWLPDKVARAVTMLNAMPQNQPNMYCGRRICVDEQLKEVGYSILPRIVGFENALVENIAAGCTMMLNHAAHQLMIQVIPSKLKMYDWWCYLVISAFGQVYYDPQPFMLYRQHRGNLKGDTPLWYKQIWERMIRLIKQRRGAYGICDQVTEFVELYGDQAPKRMSNIAKQLVNSQQSVFTRLNYSLTTPAIRQTPYDQLLLRFLILLGMY